MASDDGSERGNLDPHVVDGLYAQYAESLQRFLWGVLRDGTLVQDALQAAFAKLVEKGGMVQESSRKAWLFKVAYHEALLVRRQQASQRLAQQQLEWMRPTTAPPAHEEGLQRHEAVAQIRQALADLPAQQRIVVELKIYQEKTFAEIAEHLNIPLGTALTRMRAGLGKLRERLLSLDDNNSRPG